jgi:hypothetical protein
MGFDTAIKVDSVQVSSKLRKMQGGYAHWCPACESMHCLPDSWNFVNKDLENPTFTPSFLHTLSNSPRKVCHYILTNGILNFCGDCSHGLAGKPVPLPELPDFLKD